VPTPLPPNLARTTSVSQQYEALLPQLLEPCIFLVVYEIKFLLEFGAGDGILGILVAALPSYCFASAATGGYQGREHKRLCLLAAALLCNGAAACLWAPLTCSSNGGLKRTTPLRFHSPVFVTRSVHPLWLCTHGLQAPTVALQPAWLCTHCALIAATHSLWLCNHWDPLAPTKDRGQRMAVPHAGLP
jgi:hypothetical protein